MFHYYLLNYKGCMMLLSFTLEELKMLSVAIQNNNFEFIYESSPLWENREKYYKLDEKLSKEIAYYDIEEY